MKNAKSAKPAKAARSARPAKAAKPAKPARAACAARAAAAIAAAVCAVILCGCATNLTRTPILSEGQDGETVVAYATNIKLGIGTKEATSIGSYNLSATGGLAITDLDQKTDSTAVLLSAIQLGAQLGGAYIGRAGVAAGSAATDPGNGAVSPLVGRTGPRVAPPLPREAVATGELAVKMAEAKASGRPLVVIAGNIGCGYCARLDKLLDADAAFTGRTDIVLYRETAEWADNAAARWTGGGKLPALRVTQWDAAGAVVCDKKVNRPQSIAAIEAALQVCEISE